MKKVFLFLSLTSVLCLTSNDRSFALCSNSAGNTIVGATPAVGNLGFVIAAGVTFNTALSVDTIQVYVGAAGSSIIGYFFNNNGSQPGTLLGQSAGQTVTATGWTTLQLLSPVVVAATNYWSCYSSDSNSFGVNKDVATWDRAFISASYAVPPPNGSSWTTQNNVRDSMYVTGCLITQIPNGLTLLGVGQ